MSQLRPETKSGWRSLMRFNHALGPIAAGVIIDAVDFVTFGPIGLVLGFPIGATAGYWLGRSMHLEKQTSFICAVIAGIYCTIPGTELLPLGTLVGALVRFDDVPAINATTDPQSTEKSEPQTESLRSVEED